MRQIFDREDRSLAGAFILVVLLVLAGALVLGLAVRIFLFASGLR